LHAGDIHTKSEFSSVSNQSNSDINTAKHYTTKANKTDAIASPSPLDILHNKITKLKAHTPAHIHML
jgi:hypothetical protein